MLDGCKYFKLLASYRIIMCGCKHSVCGQLFDLCWWIHDFTGTESGADPCKAYVILTTPAKWNDVAPNIVHFLAI